MTYWQSESFKSLQAAWYERLAKDGFEDAEELVAGEMVLKQVAAHPYRTADELGITTKESYYRLLGQNVQQSNFQSDIDRLILTMFAEGAKMKKIGDALRTMGHRRCRNTICFTIRKYEMRWGLRSYTPKQLNRYPRTA